MLENLPARTNPRRSGVNQTLGRPECSSLAQAPVRRRLPPPVSGCKRRLPRCTACARNRHLRRSITRFRWSYGGGNFSKQNWGDPDERRQKHWPVGASCRLTWLPGDAAECDLWFLPTTVGLEDSFKPLLVMVITAAHSRFMVGPEIPTRKTEDLLRGMWLLLQLLGRVPRRLIWDIETGIGASSGTRKGSVHSPAPWPPRCSA